MNEEEDVTKEKKNEMEIFYECFTIVQLAHTHSTAILRNFYHLKIMKEKENIKPKTRLRINSPTIQTKEPLIKSSFPTNKRTKTKKRATDYLPGSLQSLKDDACAEMC